MKRYVWLIFSIFMGLHAVAENAHCEPITAGTLLLFSLISAAAAGGASIYGGYQAGKAQETALAYQKEKDSYNRLRTKRVEAFNRQQALLSNQIQMRQLAMNEEAARFEKKRTAIYSTSQILDWFEGYQQRQKQKRAARTIGEFGIIPVQPLTREGGTS